ncbi:MAG TPA: DUF72 domain-containing protein, partial [Woeseiaceae bacterium]|nr:DUF72 domain-containing protein [Woeseiaceae bacterium]
MSAERQTAKGSAADGRGRARIGTSGWSYGHWEDAFYPEGLATGERLAFYARRFATVELNNSFYQLPAREQLEQWRDMVHDDFVFAVKASRYITHMKKLKDPAESLERFLGRVEALGSTLGPVLFQLPPRWHRDPDRLASFLRQLPGEHRYAFEFRDPSWHAGETYSALREAGAAFCIYNLAGEVSPKEITADFVYIRLHGPDGAYQGSYDAQ